MRFLVLIPAVIHVLVFLLECFTWGKPFTNRLFRIRSADAEATRLLAFNQGVYYLLLAVAVVAGWCLWMGVPAFDRGPFAGQVLMTYGLASITIAGLTLLASFPKLWWPALVQLVPAVAGLLIVLCPGV